MNSIHLKNGRVATDGKSPDGAGICISDGVISPPIVSCDTEYDLAGLTLSPGYIDIHSHGAVGVDVNTADTDGLLMIAAFLAKNGVTSWVPTLVPDSEDNYRRAINMIDELMLIQVGQPVAQAVGVHYEGVFASEKMCGALRPEFFKTFTGNHSVGTSTAPPQKRHPSCPGGELLGLPRLKRGVHMTTVAPEIDGGIELIEELVKQNWIVSIGHTKADTATLDRAFAAGARHMTHFFNAMTGIHHREIGVAGWGLANGAVTFDIIADGIHVDPKILEFAVRSKTPEKVSLISDSVGPTGLGDGVFELWGEEISVTQGRTRNERGSIAGSVITMLDAARMMLSLGFSPVEISQMASRNPARILGIDSTHGTIAVGKRADLVALDNEGNARFVMIGGQIVDLN